MPASRKKSASTSSDGKRPESRRSARSAQKAARKAEKQGAGLGGRERLIEAAIERFAAKGYAATGTAEVCAAAGVAKTALYWHFENKEGLLAAVLTQVGTQWIEQLQKAAYLEGGPEKRLRRLTEEWRRIVLEQPELLRLPLVAQLEQGHSEVSRDALHTLWLRSQRALVEGIEDTVGVPVPGVELVAHTIHALLQGAMLRHMGNPDPELLDQMLEDLQRTVLLAVIDRLPEGATLETWRQAPLR